MTTAFHAFNLTEFLHWLGTACLIASILLRFIPTPEEVPNHIYIVIYNTLRRMSINQGYQVRANGDPPISTPPNIGAGLGANLPK